MTGVLHTYTEEFPVEKAEKVIIARRNKMNVCGRVRAILKPSDGYVLVNMKLFLNIYDLSKTAVIKLLLTITEAERNVHMLWK